MQSPDELKRFHEDGYLRVRGVFSLEEIERFRSYASRLQAGEVDTRYFHEISEMQDFWRDQRLIAIARDILSGPLVYCFSGHFHRYDFAQGDNDTARHLHHDAKGTAENIYNRYNQKSEQPYPVLRFAIYLQDTETQSGGLKVAVGSHLRDVSDFQPTDFRLENLASQPGDVVAFTPRILHSPLALRFKDGRDTVLTPHEENTLVNSDPDLFLPIPQIRQTLFIDYLAEGELADLYVKNRAIQKTTEDDSLSRVLIDEGFLLKNRDAEIAFRVDRAIAETADNIARHVKDGQLDTAGLPHLLRLPALCLAHEETSPHHVIHTGSVPDTTPQTALRLYNEIAPRIVAIREQARASSRKADPQMESLPFYKRTRG